MSGDTADTAQPLLAPGYYLMKALQPFADVRDIGMLLQRAGWGVHMAPTVDGSYENSPPCLVDLIVRDRRWAQGNLQHLKIVGQAGLTPMGRVHLLMGAFSRSDAAEIRIATEQQGKYR